MGQRMQCGQGQTLQSAFRVQSANTAHTCRRMGEWPPATALTGAQQFQNYNRTQVVVRANAQFHMLVLECTRLNYRRGRGEGGAGAHVTHVEHAIGGGGLAIEGSAVTFLKTLVSAGAGAGTVVALPEIGASAGLGPPEEGPPAGLGPTEEGASSAGATCGTH